MSHAVSTIKPGKVRADSAASTSINPLNIILEISIRYDEDETWRIDKILCC